MNEDTGKHAARVVVSFFPSASDLAENPYWTILRDGLIDAGLEVDDTAARGFGVRWLWEHRSRSNVLHFHFIQQFYAYEWTQARLGWILRFARNLLLARMLGYRVVYTLHNLEPTQALRPGWVDYLGHWAIANLSHAVIVHCEASRRLLARRYGRRRNVYTVHHPNFIGAYPNNIGRLQAREVLGLPPGARTFLFFGGIRPNKGVQGLVDAFRRVPGDALRLVIAGDPRWAPNYFAQIQTAAEHDRRILLHPRLIPDEEVQVFLNAADCVVLPFDRILTSGSAHLAMSFDRPIIAPAVGCLPELVGDNAGWLYPPDEPDALLKTLTTVSITDLSNYANQARNKVQQFDQSSMSHETMAAYGISH